MVTVKSERTYLLVGLDTDTKPTGNIANGSVFIEMNTSKVYLFDGSTSSWIESPKKNVLYLFTFFGK